MIRVFNDVNPKCSSVFSSRLISRRSNNAPSTNLDTFRLGTVASLFSNASPSPRVMNLIGIPFMASLQIAVDAPFCTKKGFVINGGHCGGNCYGNHP